MKKINLIVIVWLFLSVSSLFGAERNDSIRIYPDSTVNVKTGAILLGNQKIDSIKTEEAKDSVFKPDAVKSIWWGAIIPGFGQIANKKYWKLPFVYGGFLGFAYAITWNNNQYNSFKNAYRDIIDNDPNTKSYLDILPKGVTIDQLGGMDAYASNLKMKQDNFRRYRDLSILLSIGYYGLVLLEAYVDAKLYDFNITPDLVLNVAPTRIQLASNSHAAYGLQCNIRF